MQKEVTQSILNKLDSHAKDNSIDNVAKLNFFTRVAKRLWQDGLVNQEVADMLDTIVSNIMLEDELHISYIKWMNRRSNATSNIEKINKFYDICFSHVDIPKEYSILDVGTRAGVGLELLKRRGYKNIRGIELCKEAADRCKDLDVDVGDIHTTKYKSEVFDLIILADVLEHCYDQDMVMAEVYRILKPNGYVFTNTPTEIALSWNNCRRLTLGRFSDIIHNVGFIFKWLEVQDRIVNNPIYDSRMTGVLQK